MLVNGKPQTTIALSDRGLLYGDGVFETFLCEQGQPLLFDLHMQRLQRGCQRLSLSLQDSAVIRQEIEQVAANKDAVIRVSVTRGERVRGYRYERTDMSFNRIVMRDDHRPSPSSNTEQGIALYLCQHRLPQHAVLAGIKHLNRLDQVLARSEWDSDYAEGLLLNDLGEVIEGCMSNLFVLRDNIWTTPDLSHSGVDGVMRDYLLGAASECGQSCQIDKLELVDLLEAEAMFLCNSVIGIWPVLSFQKQHYNSVQKVQPFMHHLHEKLSILYPAGL
ncbi:MAG: aminodeoxychorismate lyase [Gammaproteobacteria bacterium]|nr:aminodeoxychorismate lyase [Gammaproteobacteria bacterium]